MKRIVALIVVLLFTAMFGYLFFANIGDCLDIFKNIEEMSVNTFSIYERVLFTTVYGFGGFIGSLVALIRVATNRTRRLDRMIGSMISTLVAGFVMTEIISVLPSAIEYSRTDIFTSEEFVKMYLILGFDIVASIGLGIKNNRITQAVVTSIGLVGIIVMDILLMKETGFTLDDVELVPQLTHIYLFTILGSVLAGVYIWWKDDNSIRAY